MSGEPPPGAPPRHAQGDELIAAIRSNTAAVVALAAAVGMLLKAVHENTEVLREPIDDDDDDVCPDCEDPACDGDCEDEPPRRRRR